MSIVFYAIFAGGFVGFLMGVTYALRTTEHPTKKQLKADKRFGMSKADLIAQMDVLSRAEAEIAARWQPIIDGERQDKEKMKNDLYDERNAVVVFAALLARKVGIPVSIVEDPKEPEWPVVVFDLPERGQVTWHLPKHLVTHILHQLPPDPNYKYDGHTTPEKYDRLGHFCNMLTEN